MKMSSRLSYLCPTVAFVFSATLASTQVEWNHDPAREP
jgi:hypothetical protein